VHDRLDQVVPDQLTCGHHATDLRAELRVVLDVPAEDLAHADLRDVQTVGEQGCLGALATALHAHENVLPHSRKLWQTGRSLARRTDQGRPVQRKTTPTRRKLDEIAHTPYTDSYDA